MPRPPMTTESEARSPRLREKTSGLAVLGGRIWGSWHLYPVGLDDYLRVASTLISPLVKEMFGLSFVDCFFFIRYADGEGEHIRLRFRFQDGDSGVVRRVARVMRKMTAQVGLKAVLRPFELEVERYGGREYFPYSLEFFCLSSLAALDWLALHGSKPRCRQLSAIMNLLTCQAVALARDLDELALLLDYFAGWQSQMEVPVRRGNRTFENNPGQFISFIEYCIEFSLATSDSLEAMIQGARSLSIATLGLTPEVRSEMLKSHMHMTANRLGLRNTEEAYITQILRRALDELVKRSCAYSRELDRRLGLQKSAGEIGMLVSRSLVMQ